MLATTSLEVQLAIAQGKIASLLGVEGSVLHLVSQRIR
jgi:hypothetical protein